MRPPPPTDVTFPYIYVDQVWASGIVFPAVCIFLTVLRFWTRKRRRLGFGWDEWLICAALCGIIGMGACFIYGAAKHVFGFRTPVIHETSTQLLYHTPEPIALNAKVEFVFQLFMLWSYGFVKLSIVMFCRRVFVVHKRTAFDIITKILIVIICLWTLIFLLFFIFTCGTHVGARWGAEVKLLADCPIGFPLELGMASSDLGLDVIVWCLPFPMIWSLRMSKTRAASLSGVFLVGLMCIAASIARLVLYVQILTTITHAHDDVMLIVTTSLWWSFLEAGVAYIAACLPCLNGLLLDLHPFRTMRDIVSSLTSSLRSRVSNDTTDPATAPSTVAGATVVGTTAYAEEGDLSYNARVQSFSTGDKSVSTGDKSVSTGDKSFGPGDKAFNGAEPISVNRTVTIEMENLDYEAMDQRKRMFD